jgi:alpha-1,3-rhamnosyl/mannosyltransferase
VHIRIDATSLLLRSAGIKSYTWHWLRHLQAQAPPNVRVDAFPMIGDTPTALDHEHSPFGTIPTYARLAALYAVNVGGPGALDQFLRGVDVFHCSNQVRVAPRRCRITATIHDMTCWLMPEVHTEANVRADASFAREILKRATRLIAVSENTRQDAMRLLDLAPDRIDTIYSGVDDRFFSAEPAKCGRPYVLFLGTIEPRKNVDTLLDAWESLPADLRNEFDLLIAGPAGWRSESTMARLSDSSSGAKYLGYVPEASIPSLTAGASAFAYISRYEGFGFPVAQAMAAGVPVLTSNTSCLPEVAAEGGLFVDPQSPAEIAKGLTRLLTNQELRRQLGSAGRARAARLFRWEECARRSHAFFAAST